VICGLVLELLKDIASNSVRTMSVFLKIKMMIKMLDLLFGKITTLYWYSFRHVNSLLLLISFHLNFNCNNHRNRKIGLAHPKARLILFHLLHPAFQLRVNSFLALHLIRRSFHYKCEVSALIIN